MSTMPSDPQAVRFDRDEKFWLDWERNWLLYGTVYAINNPEPRVVPPDEFVVVTIAERDRLARALAESEGRLHEERKQGRIDVKAGIEKYGCCESDPPLLCPCLRDAKEALAESEERLSVAYAERNLVAQLAAHFADELGWPVWWGVDPAEPDWPVLYIEGPTGQVSWHMPKAEAIGRYSDPGSRLVEKRWDGHTTEEKDDRIRAALLEGEPDAR